MVTDAELNSLFDGATSSIFRLETLPSYDVDEEADRITAWRAGRPRPEQTVRTSSWLAEVAAGTLAGVHWRRVRVVDDPLTEYQRYELAALAEMQAAGCSVQVARRAHVPTDWKDAWLFDVDTERAAGVTMNYSATGRFVDMRWLAREDLAPLQEGPLAASIPLNEYLLTVRDEQRPTS